MEKAISHMNQYVRQTDHNPNQNHNDQSDREPCFKGKSACFFSVIGLISAIRGIGSSSGQNVFRSQARALRGNLVLIRHLRDTLWLRRAAWDHFRLSIPGSQMKHDSALKETGVEAA